MNNTLIKQIKDMHIKFGINNEIQQDLSPEEKKFRINCMLEEIQEYAESKTLSDMNDSILDLIIFAMGTLERHGLLEIMEECFNRIMKANNAKTIGTASKERQGGPAFKLDLVKPAGWVAPNFDDLVKE